MNAAFFSFRAQSRVSTTEISEIVILNFTVDRFRNAKPRWLQASPSCLKCSRSNWGPSRSEPRAEADGWHGAEDGLNASFVACNQHVGFTPQIYNLPIVYLLGDGDMHFYTTHLWSVMVWRSGMVYYIFNYHLEANCHGVPAFHAASECFRDTRGLKINFAGPRSRLPIRPC